MDDGFFVIDMGEVVHVAGEVDLKKFCKYRPTVTGPMGIRRACAMQTKIVNERRIARRSNLGKPEV